MKNNNFRVLGELSTLGIAIFLISLDFIFLGTLIIAGIVSDLILYFVVRNNSVYKDNIISLYKKVGYYSYLFSLGYMAILIILFQFKILDADLTLNMIFFGVILLFPLVALFIRKK